MKITLKTVTFSYTIKSDSYKVEFYPVKNETYKFRVIIFSIHGWEEVDPAMRANTGTGYKALRAHLKKININK